MTHILSVEVDNHDAYHLIKELDTLHILKIIKEDEVEEQPRLSQKYRGVFTKEDAQSFMEHTQQSRREW